MPPLCNVVSCAGEAIAVAAQANKILQAFFQTLSFAMIVLHLPLSASYSGPKPELLNRALALRGQLKQVDFLCGYTSPGTHGRVWDAHLSMTTSAARSGFAVESCY